MRALSFIVKWLFLRSLLGSLDEKRISRIVRGKLGSDDYETGNRFLE